MPDEQPKGESMKWSDREILTEARKYRAGVLGIRELSDLRRILCRHKLDAGRRIVLTAIGLEINRRINARAN